MLEIAGTASPPVALHHQCVCVENSPITGAESESMSLGAELQRNCNTSEAWVFIHIQVKVRC